LPAPDGEKMSAMNFPEKAVVEIWRHQLTGRIDLATEDGRPIQVIYPGMISGGHGADFVDAVIRTGFGLIRGGVEIHVDSSGWWRHGHHEDPAYNGVILHVVYNHDRKQPVRLQNGHVVPTLVLDRFIKGQRGASNQGVNRTLFPALPCRDIATMMNGNILRKVLEAAGEERILARIAEYKTKITRVGAAQALYSGIMESLGYTKNKNQMKTLAGLLPLAKLEALITADSEGKNCLFRLQSLLLGAAGLLPSQYRGKRDHYQPTDTWLIKLDALWEFLGEKSYLARDEWHFFKVRPGNHPVLRLAAMGCLLFRYRAEGILKGLAENISPDYREIEESLYVPSTGYDNAGTGQRFQTAPLGRERAAAIAVNVLLPLAAARAELASCQEEFRRILKIFRQYHRLAMNNLERHMQQQFLIEKDRITSARQQQGLIQIYRNQCSLGNCPTCPLNAPADNVGKQ
jgi:hypothetical protein